MRDLVSELLRPSAQELSPRTRAQLLGHDDEGAYTHLVSTELGPLVYQRLQTHRADLAPPVLARLEDQSRLTMEHNAFLVDELEKISATCGAREIPLMVIKGPALAYLTAGLYVRPFHDLDVVVHRHNFQDAAQALHSIGYTEVRTALGHEYHRIFARQGGQAVSLVELHFDLGDRERAIAPDVPGIWHRSKMLTLSQYAVRVPSVTDHLLLTMMQLPHHGWSLRLLTDVGLIVSRRPDEVEWGELACRARAWGMWALAASTLYMLDAMFGVSVPEPVRSEVRPHNYFRRAQWHVVMDAVAVRLAPSTSIRETRLTSLLIQDRIRDVVSLVARRAVSKRDWRTPTSAAVGPARRVMEGASSLPALARILVKSIRAYPRREPQQTPRSTYSGSR